MVEAQIRQYIESHPKSRLITAAEELNICERDLAKFYYPEVSQIETDLRTFDFSKLGELMFLSRTSTTVFEAMGYVEQGSSSLCEGTESEVNLRVASTEISLNWQRLSQALLVKNSDGRCSILLFDHLGATIGKFHQKPLSSNWEVLFSQSPIENNLNFLPFVWPTSSKLNDARKELDLNVFFEKIQSPGIAKLSVQTEAVKMGYIPKTAIKLITARGWENILLPEFNMHCQAAQLKWWIEFENEIVFLAEDGSRQLAITKESH